MSGDRILALCEYGNGTWWSLDDDDPAVQRQNTLAEIAEAAQDVLRIVERDTLEVNALRSALVRLDSGAAEEDA